jgi:hypothetical protein
VVFIVSLLVAGFPDALAIWLAPRKAATSNRSERAKAADVRFWESLHGGRYEDLPRVLEELTAAYLEDPRDAQTAAHLGFSHVWRLSGRVRLDTPSATITDELALARRYFSEAVRLAPDDERLGGFLASMELAEGSIHADRKLTTRGYLHLKKAKDGRLCDESPSVHGRQVRRRGGLPVAEPRRLRGREGRSPHRSVRELHVEGDDHRPEACVLELLDRAPQLRGVLPEHG